MGTSVVAFIIVAMVLSFFSDNSFVGVLICMGVVWFFYAVLGHFGGFVGGM